MATERHQTAEHHEPTDYQDHSVSLRDHRDLRGKPARGTREAARRGQRERGRTRRREELQRGRWHAWEEAPRERWGAGRERPASHRRYHTGRDGWQARA